ncbi:MAG: phage holin family protein [Mycobacteriales bacterium]
MATRDGSVPVEDRSLGALVATVSRDLSLLVHQEVALAKAELSAEGKRVGLASGLLGAAGATGLLGAVFLSIAAAFGLAALGIGLGYGFLCVGFAYLLVAGLFGSLGLAKLIKIGKPERTIRTVSDSLAWARHPTVSPDRELEELKARHAG